MDIRKCSPTRILTAENLVACRSDFSPDVARRSRILRASCDARLFVSSMRLTPLGLTRYFVPHKILHVKTNRTNCNRAIPRQIERSLLKYRLILNIACPPSCNIRVSRELQVFATKVAPTKSCKLVCAFAVISGFPKPVYNQQIN